LDVAFCKDGEIDDYYNAKIIKYQRVYGAENIIPFICRYDGTLYERSKIKFK